LAGDAGDVAFSDVERPIKAYLLALWRLRVPIAAAGTAEPLRRASFEAGFVRMPQSFRGVVDRAEATELFRAALAHIAAHLVFGGAKFPVAGLKPVQIALISLIEDARVEQRAIAVFPGLRRLWLPFHRAAPSDALIAPVLMARLARALIDPDHRDDNGWVS